MTTLEMNKVSDTACHYLSEPTDWVCPVCGEKGLGE